MEDKQNIVKISFFKKVWYSITKFEQYPAMAAEGLNRTIKYLVILTAIVTVFVMIGSLLQMKTLIKDLAEYVQTNMPEFSYAEGKIFMEIQDTIVINDIEYAGIDRIVINTLTETDEQKEQLKKDNLINGTTIFLFGDEVILKTKPEDSQVLEQSYTYNDFIATYIGTEVQNFDKTQFVQYLTSDKMNTFYLSYGTSIFIYLFIINILVALLDTLEIAILGLITATIAKIRMKFIAIYNMAAYSLTLPMILNILYIIVNYFTNFTITYFQVGYITIAYIYLAATIFILKDDIIKRMQEVEKIKQEQINVRKEIKEEQEEKGSLEDGQR